MYSIDYREYMAGEITDHWTVPVLSHRYLTRLEDDGQYRITKELSHSDWLVESVRISVVRGALRRRGFDP